MRIVFAGTPDVAVPSLTQLARGHDIVGVVTRPDAAQGRKREMLPSAVARRAHELGLVTFKRARFDTSLSAEIADLQPDLGVVVAFGGMIPRVARDIPRLGWINLHFSKLPEWRGASPLQHEIMAGSSVAHVTIFRLVEELDAGDVLASKASPLGAHETAGNALNRLGDEGANLLSTVVAGLAVGGVVGVPQTGRASYAPKLSSAQGQLLSHNTLEPVYNLFRAVTPEPGAWIDTTSGRIKVLDCAPEHERRVPEGRISVAQDHVVIGFHDGALGLRRVQPAGKSAMSAADWARGIHSLGDWYFA